MFGAISHLEKSAIVFPDQNIDAKTYQETLKAAKIPTFLQNERATTKEGIKKVARKVWRAITPEYLNSLYESIPRRIAAVIAAEGGHTNY